MAQILCVGCRAGTPASAPNAPTPCRTCGTLLPPPGTRSWWMSRGEAQFGPYTFAELVSYVGDGRLLQDDCVWHDGARVRAIVNTLPPLAQTPAAAPTYAPAPAYAANPAYAATPAYAAAPVYGAAGPAAPQLTDRIKREVTRAAKWDLSTVPVEPDEEAKLIANGVDDEDARRYIAWRRSVLLVVTYPTLLFALLATWSFLQADKSGLTGLGTGLELVRIAMLFALPATAWLAAKCWDNHRRSRTILLKGWLVAFMGPLALALVPYTWRIDLRAANPQMDASQLESSSAGLGLGAALAVFVMLLPTVLSLIPGVMRACLRIKTLIPESILPGFFLIAATPFYMLLALVIFTAVNQFAGHLLLIVAVGCILGGPVLYMLNSRTFIRPLRTPEEVAKIGAVQKMVSIIILVGLGVLIFYLFTVPMAGTGGRTILGANAATSLVRPWNANVIQFPIEYVVRSLFTMALVADLIMLMNLALWRQSQAFHAAPEAAQYDRLMTEIEEAGGRGLAPTEIVLPSQP